MTVLSFYNLNIIINKYLNTITFIAKLQKNLNFYVGHF